MKRKDFQGIDEDFSSSPFNSHPAKSRRLDGELLQEENPRFHGEEVMGECLVELEPQIAVNNNEVIQAAASATDAAMPTVDNPNEKAIVLYQPSSSSLPRSPSSPEFSIVLNSNLIPGLRDRIFWPGNQKSDEDKLAAERSINKSVDNSLAVIPWVAPQPLMNTVANHGHPTVRSELEAMEAEDADMMDTDESYGGSVQDSAVRTTAEGTESMLQWQQQQRLQQWMMLPGVAQNRPTPVTW